MPEIKTENRMPPKLSDGFEIRFPLDGENEVVIRLKHPVSRKQFGRITQLLQLSEESLVGQTDDSQ